VRGVAVPVNSAAHGDVPGTAAQKMAAISATECA
jgi:hypothetical protein